MTLLEAVMRRDPDHIGANHLYIHAVEASHHPERALEAAARLPGLAPSCGHLVHMPSHVYSRTGDSVASAGSNEAAIAADEAYFRKGGKTDGIYGMMYYNHNIHFLAVASADAGNYQQAKAAAEKLAAHAGEHVKHMPMLEGFMLTPLYVAVRFAKWDELLSAPEPDKSLAGLHAMWHFARGMAHAGRGNTSAAETERAALAAEHKALRPRRCSALTTRPMTSSRSPRTAWRPRSPAPQATRNRPPSGSGPWRPARTSSTTSSPPTGTSPPANPWAPPCSHRVMPPGLKKPSATTSSVTPAAAGRSSG